MTTATGSQGSSPVRPLSFAKDPFVDLGGRKFGAPPPPTSPPPTTKDLPEFIDFVKELLDKMTGDWASILFPQPRRAALRGAFEDLDTRDVFGQVKNEIDGADDSLKKVGLTDTQLEMKLSKFDQLRERFFFFGGIKWLGRLIGWINKILESLGTVIFGGHAIKELKDACEEEMKDTE